MLLPRNDNVGGDVDWQSVWADLLQGIGAGLLHDDGSRLAQASLMGLNAFDAAQERRGRWESPEPSGGEDREHPLALPWSEMSAAELASFLRLSPEDRHTLRQEAAESGLSADLPDRGHRLTPGNGEANRGNPSSAVASLSFSRQPLSPDPFAGWPLEAILPFGRDGRLNIPILHR